MQLLRGAPLALFALGVGIAIVAPVFVHWRSRRDRALMAMPAAREVWRRILLGTEVLATWAVVVAITVDMIPAFPAFGKVLAILSAGLGVLGAYLLGSGAYYRWLALHPDGESTTDRSTDTNRRGGTERD